MRIVIDLQGKQSSGSKNRGIGRYSLSISQAIVRNKKDHEVIIFLSSLFPDEIDIIKNKFKHLLPPENIVVWDGIDGSSYLNETTALRKSAELSRELFLKDLNPDVIYITSLFEGLGEPVITSIGSVLSDIPVAVTLYDLIPLINEKPYLDNPSVKSWYLDKIEYLKQAELLLSISESSRQEALEYLDSKAENVVNIGTAADPQFKKIELSTLQKNTLLKRYNIKYDFLMYTGGIDLRKNIEGLIRSYALLPQQLRNQHQLAIVCSINEYQKNELEILIKQLGLGNDEVIFTGFIPEEDLVQLYNTCKVFVFPSWHEGFGLPVLEAMHCGAPVIAANTSSLPEVVGIEDALFDPYDDQEIANKIELVLTDNQFRKKLCEHSLKQCLTFSWDNSAQKAITAFERLPKKSKPTVSVSKRLKLAYISPLPPERSGIADYSADLLRELYCYYDIDVVVEQESISCSWINEHCSVIDSAHFRANTEDYDRVLYHFGNSEFHQHMFNLLIEVPGTVVLHDFYLSGAINYMDVTGYDNFSFEDELFYSHGNDPFIQDNIDLVREYPCNRKVLDYAKGVIVHSENSIKLAKEWYGKTYANDWQVIPLLRKPATVNNKDVIRQKLNIPSNAVVIASFGIMYQTKLNLELIKAWLDSSLSADENCYLIFVGGKDQSGYGYALEQLVKTSEYSSRVIFTDWTDAQTFKDYLSITDVGVQLRSISRGETSAAVLDCMNYGIATIVNANGSMSELPQDSVYMLEDKFRLKDLITALESLVNDKSKRKKTSSKAVLTINKKHSPENCALQYVEAIEAYYKKTTIKKEGLVKLKNKVTALEEQTHQFWLRATETEAKANELEAKANELEAKAKEIETMNHDMIRSTSWRLTGPFRFFGRFTKMMLSSASVKHKCYLVIKSLTYRVKRVPLLRKYIVKMFFKFPKIHEIYNNKLNVAESEKIKVEIDCLNIREQKIYNDIQLSLYKWKK